MNNFVGNDRPYVSQGTDLVKSRATNFTDLTIHCKVIIKSDSQNLSLISAQISLTFQQMFYTRLINSSSSRRNYILILVQ